MKKGVIITGLVLAGIIRVIILIFSAILELAEGILALVGWRCFFDRWLVYKFKFEA